MTLQFRLFTNKTKKSYNLHQETSSDVAPIVSKHVFGWLRMEGSLPTLVEASGDWYFPNVFVLCERD